MECPHCQSEAAQRFGKDRKGNQRYRCKSCKKTWQEDQVRPLGAMRVDLHKAIDCLKLLLDGMSIRAVERFTGIHRNTICDLILTVGERCKHSSRLALKASR